MQIEKAKEIQKKLKSRVRIEHLRKNIKVVAGGDVAYAGNIAVAGVVAMNIPEFEIIEKTFAVRKNIFPYIGGFLAFREAPVLLEAIKKLKCCVDVFIFDGHGIAHPEGIGIASHIGVLINRPSIGCAKSVLIGTFSLPGRKKSNYTFLYDGNKIIGAIVRTKTDVRPVVVSPGNKINLRDAMKIVLQCTERFRMPEPVRLAHIFSNEIIRNFKKQESPNDLH